MARRFSKTFSIRTKFLFVALVLLLIPWMGYQYVREMKSFLLQGQEDALQLTARAVSTVLHDRTELFSPETGVPELVGEPNDLYAYPLARYIFLDGQTGDWGEQVEQASEFTGDNKWQCGADYDPASFSFRHVLGYRGNYFYALFQVTDDNVIYRDGDLRRLDNSDHLRITLQDPVGDIRRYLLTAVEPGRMSIYVVDDEWRFPLTGEPFYEIAAAQVDTGEGYTIEARIPRYLVSSYTRIAFSVADIDDPQIREVRRTISTVPSAEPGDLSRVLLNSPEIAKILRGLDRPVARIWVLDNQQRVRAVVGSLTTFVEQDPAPADDPQRWWSMLVQRIYGLILSKPSAQFEDISPDVSHRDEEMFLQVLSGTPQTGHRPSLDGKTEILTAAHPIWSGDEVLGAVVVEQSSNEVLTLQEKVLQNVITVTLLVLIVVTIALLLFTSQVTMRIRRLRNSTDKAISPEGRVLNTRIEADAIEGDEIGDLSRSISGMLGRLSQYTRYLEDMPDTLAHELSNPLNVVNSSLDNLEKEIPAATHSKYMLRAKNGIVRLGSILTNLTEAANLEDAMHGETRERFDLVELVSSYVDGYRISNPDRKFQVEVEDTPLLVEGAPDHIAQMLDKLVDNAVDFSDSDSAIIVRLKKLNGDARLSVLNEGRALPEEMRERLFDPMVSLGKKNAKQSHLGLGLYIVRLIAEFHRGRIEAANRSDVQGAVFTVSLPLAAG